MFPFRIAMIAGVSILLAACSDSGRVGEWKKAEVREACFKETEFANHNRPRLPENRIGLQKISRGEMLATALGCYVISNKQAVCEKNNRAYIIDYISRYFAFKRETYETAKEYGERERKVVDLFWSNVGDQRIMRAIADHVENGRLNAGDFGWFAPAELKDLLAQHKGAPDKCATEVAWQPPAQKHQLPTFEQRMKEIRR